MSNEISHLFFSDSIDSNAPIILLEHSVAKIIAICASLFRWSLGCGQRCWCSRAVWISKSCAAASASAREYPRERNWTRDAHTRRTRRQQVSTRRKWSWLLIETRTGTFKPVSGRRARGDAIYLGAFLSSLRLDDVRGQWRGKPVGRAAGACGGGLS